METECSSYFLAELQKVQDYLCSPELQSYRKSTYIFCSGLCFRGVYSDITVLQNSILLLPVLRKSNQLFLWCKRALCLCCRRVFSYYLCWKRFFYYTVITGKFSAVLVKSFFLLLAVLLMSFRLSQLLEKSVQLWPVFQNSGFFNLWCRKVKHIHIIAIAAEECSVIPFIAEECSVSVQFSSTEE